MKAVLGLLGLVALLGVLYGLAFFGVLPTQALAAKSPALAHVLIALHLAKPKKHAPVVADAAAPAQHALDTEKKRLDADRAKLDKDRADWEAQKHAPAPTSAAPPDPSADADAGAKISAIYATMSADDLARLFGKLPDPDVAAALGQLDEKKAGKILAALPADRAARLARRLSHPTPTSLASAPPAATPHVSL